LSYPGDILGYQSMMSNVPHHVSTEALKPTRICFVPLKTMQGVIERNPAAAMSFLKRMSQDLNEVEEKLYQASIWDVRSRFTRLLLDMKDRFLVSSNVDGVVIEIPVSRLKLAELIGVRPETISRIIRELSDEGVLRFKGRYVRIPNVEALSGQFGGEMAI
jgi:CRP/FNR family transcriptional regulator